MYLHFLLILVEVTTHGAEETLGITAFDCNSTNLEVLTYDLTQVAECPMKPTLNYSDNNVKVQVLQKKDSEILTVFRCKVIVHTMIWHCGMHSHTSMANYDIAPHPYDLTRADCKRMHDERSAYLDGHFYSGLKPNASTAVSITLVGSVWGEGYCSGGSFAIGGYTYANVVVKKSYNILISDQQRYYKLGTEEVMAFNGVSCRLSSPSCYDYEVGLMYWAPPQRNCHNSDYESLYEGLGKIIETTKLGPNRRYIHISATGGKQFQLFTPLVQYEPICGMDGWTTPYHGLYIIEYTGRPPFPLTKPLTVNVDLIRYIESKFMTFAYGSALSAMDIVHQLAFSQCQNHRETLLNRLHLIAANPTSANLLVGNKPGVFGRVAGEVIHILQCPAVEVQLRRSDICSLEVPVVFHGQDLYMDPRTRILTDVHTYKECSVLTPVVFRHGTTWVKMTPTFAQVDKPLIIAPSSHNDFNFKKLVSYAHGGIYDPADLQQLRDFMLFSQRHDAISSNIVAGIEGKGAPRYDLTQALSSEGWTTLAKDRLQQLWGDMKFVGEWIAGFLGIYFFIMVAKVILGTLVRVFNIYKVNGLSWKLCAGIWSCLTSLVVTTVRPRRSRGTSTDIEDEDEEGTPLRDIPRPAERASLYPSPNVQEGM